MVTTFSGIFPIDIPGSFSDGESFFSPTFDSTTSFVHIERYLNVLTEVTILEPSLLDFLAVIFDGAIDRIADKVIDNTHSEFLIFRTNDDFRFTPATTASGITILELGADINFSYTVPERINQRIFPVSVELATLFPGDVPRGDPLN